MPLDLLPSKDRELRSRRRRHSRTQFNFSQPLLSTFHFSPTWSTERLEKFPSDMLQTLREEPGESGVQSADDVVAEASGVLADAAAAAAAVNNPARVMPLRWWWVEWCLRNAREGRASRSTPSLSQLRGIQRCWC